MILRSRRTLPLPSPLDVSGTAESDILMIFGFADSSRLLRMPPMRISEMIVAISILM